VKITDFGLSVPHDDANALLGSRRFQGTLDYCAPEYRSGLALDGRYDVFSLATLSYELLTGRLPGRVYFPASRRNPRLPAGLDDVLAAGWPGIRTSDTPRSPSSARRWPPPVESPRAVPFRLLGDTRPRNIAG